MYAHHIPNKAFVAAQAAQAIAQLVFGDNLVYLDTGGGGTHTHTNCQCLPFSLICSSDER